MKLLRDQKPDYIAVAFDVKGPTFRHEAFEDYKATRKATPDDADPPDPLHQGDRPRVFASPCWSSRGSRPTTSSGRWPAGRRGRAWTVVIVSGDKDLMQLVSTEIVMIDTMKDKTYDAAAVEGALRRRPRTGRGDPRPHG
ncbi:MAG: hypothetical protein MZV70_75460 [Desulfobacterales bacterium]|nr:hypothetical protein [Desulfobacterales bacterium]